MSRTTRQLLTCMFSIWFAFASTVSTIANAQSDGVDFEAPIIDHEEITSGVLGDVEVFAASVVDNAELKSVSLFYRYAGETEFTEVPMQPLFDSSYYSAKVDTSSRSGTDTAIEYYLRAEDEAGNVVLKGLSFDPFVRSLSAPPVPSAPDALATAEPAPPVEPASKGGINWLYVGLGALLVGGLAAAAGGGGGDDDDDGTGQPTDCCRLTLTLEQPQ